MNKSTINNPITANVMDISTGHITKKDNKILKQSINRGEYWRPIVYGYDEGYFVYVPQDCVQTEASEWKEHGLSS